MTAPTSRVTHLRLKEESGKPLIGVDAFRFSKAGIEGAVPSHPNRQVLLLQTSTLEEAGVRPGDLRENIVIDTSKLYGLRSGTVIRLGEAEIRLTYHCEVCARVSSFAKPKTLLRKRGYLGAFLNDGTIHVGDEFSVLDRRFEEIPYEIVDRVIWFLDQHPGKPVTTKELLSGLGLSSAYARAIPAYLRRLPEKYQAQVIFLGSRTNR